VGLEIIVFVSFWLKLAVVKGRLDYCAFLFPNGCRKPNGYLDGQIKNPLLNKSVAYISNNELI